MPMLHVVVKGRVQGVGYRAWCVREAQALALRGWVRNQNDGSVEALFIGPAESIRMMHQACHAGPAFARVDEVHVQAHSEQDPPEAKMTHEHPHFVVCTTAGPEA